MDIHCCKFLYFQANFQSHIQLLVWLRMPTHYDLHADISNILPFNTTINNIVPHGGVSLTITINLFFCALLFGLFGFVLRPCLPLFNLKKKKMLAKQVKDLSKMYYANAIAPGVADLAQTQDEMSQNQDESNSKVVPEYRYKNLLDLSDSEGEEEHVEIEEDLASQSSLPQETQPQNETFSQRFTRWRERAKRRLQYLWVVFKELLIMIKRVTLSLLIRRHTVEDMQHLYHNYSRDVATYLLLQKEIITALIICSFLALVILLPLHLTYVPLYFFLTQSVV
jgi:hypothetical protein